jgi:hypothetical protein
MKNADFVIVFSINTPLKQPEVEEIPTKKLVIDSFPEPYRGPGA